MKPHRTDLVSFVPGVVFVAVALAALFGGLRLDALATEWFWPVSLVVIGIVVLVTSSRSGSDPVERSSDDADPDDSDRDASDRDGPDPVVDGESAG